MNIKELDNFIEFLIKAKKSTYAGNGNLSVSSRPESKDLIFEEEKLKYIDSYFGGRNFIGEEAVFFNNNPLWGMNYYGKVLIQELPEGFSEFLKEVLRNLTLEAPFRGPEVYIKDDFKYFCSWQGDLCNFDGNEIIQHNGKIIYRLSFHGGEIK